MGKIGNHRQKLMDASLRCFELLVQFLDSSRDLLHLLNLLIAGLSLLFLFRDLFAGPITKGSQIFPLHAQRAFFFIESYELFLSQLEALCFEPLVDPIKLFPNQGSI